jgi:competence protein ComEA
MPRMLLLPPRDVPAAVVARCRRALSGAGVPPDPVEEEPTGLPAAPGRLGLDRRGAAGVLMVCAVGVGLTGWFAWRGAAARQPVVGAAVSAPSRAGTAVPGPTPDPSTSRAVGPSAPLVVDVAGRVHRPGLVRVPPGSRVADALAAAGGALGGVDLTMVNLAQPLVDGEQVVVGASPGAAGVAAGSVGVVGGTAGGPAGGSATVDLNTATLDQLETLPGVGPVLAQRIVEYRTAHGRLSSVDQLADVGGIGPTRLADIRPKARV